LRERPLQGTLSHTVRLIEPRFVIPYRKSDKNHRHDAEAICGALTRSSMRFVAAKSAEQQTVLTRHRAPAPFNAEREGLMNPLRGKLPEFDLIVAQGPSA